MVAKKTMKKRVSKKVENKPKLKPKNVTSNTLSVSILYYPKETRYPTEVYLRTERKSDLWIRFEEYFVGYGLYGLAPKCMVSTDYVNKRALSEQMKNSSNIVVKILDHYPDIKFKW